MERLTYICSYLGYDGVAHLLVSLILVEIMNIWLSCWLSALIVLAIGVIKEIYDKLSGTGTPQVKDLIADVIGVFLGLL